MRLFSCLPEPEDVATGIPQFKLLDAIERHPQLTRLEPRRLIRTLPLALPERRHTSGWIGLYEDVGPVAGVDEVGEQLARHRPAPEPRR